ncbi:hypothetical protein J8273_1349 [Carpediemonas membranifera]|uniref:Uncharacterized protein n=1 Tax=Carpediemonas membranifera TaxID=201153 RepID=A0A8J6E200_9EUKA|nr:hypothetical protein J8273_1349 [Carpediemonas membranifera]|eukprot:KAG9396999.1 hypothetical protein J8273_1349 [Carpediemonas membranifera]
MSYANQQMEPADEILTSEVKETMKDVVNLQVGTQLASDMIKELDSTTAAAVSSAATTAFVKGIALNPKATNGERLETIMSSLNDSLTPDQKKEVARATGRILQKQMADENSVMRQGMNRVGRIAANQLTDEDSEFRRQLADENSALRRTMKKGGIFAAMTIQQQLTTEDSTTRKAAAKFGRTTYSQLTTEDSATRKAAAKGTRMAARQLADENSTTRKAAATMSRKTVSQLQDPDSSTRKGMKTMGKMSKKLMILGAKGAKVGIKAGAKEIQKEYNARQTTSAGLDVDVDVD